jgi:hypothetical protein
MTAFHEQQITMLRQALSNTLVAIELIRMQVQDEPGVDLTPDQVAQLLTTAEDGARVALDATARVGHA